MPSPSPSPRIPAAATAPMEGPTDYVTFRVEKQLFGVPILRVQDILALDRIACVPLAPPYVRGSINLRGRIVTVIDMRVRLGIDAPPPDAARGMGVTVDYGHDLYTLLVDRMGDVIRLAPDSHDSTISTLDPAWREITSGTYRLKDELLVALEIDRVLDLRPAI